MSRCELAEVRVRFLLFPGSGVSKLLMQCNGSGRGGVQCAFQEQLQ